MSETTRHDAGPLETSPLEAHPRETDLTEHGPHEATEQVIGSVVRRILVDEIYLDVEPDAIDPEDSLVDDIGLGSLDLSELRSQCEARFGLEITDVDFNQVNFHSVATLTAFLAASLARRPSAAAAA